MAEGGYVVHSGMKTIQKICKPFITFPRLLPHDMSKRQRTPDTTAPVVDFASYDERREAAAAAAKYQKTGVHASDGLNLKKGVTPLTNNVGVLGGFGGGAGFADAMNKLLGSATKASSSSSSSSSSSKSNSKSTSISKSNQSSVIMSKRKTPNMRQIEEDRNETRTEKKSRQERAAMDQIKRSQPTIEAYRYEKELKKIATRGVVALFNAVSEAQKPAEDDNSGVVAKDMDKSDFLDMLQKKSSPGTGGSTSSSTGAAENTTPSYLRDDYMTGASMKHWDQEDEEESDEAASAASANEDSDSGDSD